jgi:hypothetical protein
MNTDDTRTAADYIEEVDDLLDALSTDPSIPTPELVAALTELWRRLGESIQLLQQT